LDAIKDLTDYQDEVGIFLKISNFKMPMNKKSLIAAKKALKELR